MWYILISEFVLSKILLNLDIKAEQFSSPIEYSGVKSAK